MIFRSVSLFTHTHKQTNEQAHTRLEQEDDHLPHYAGTPPLSARLRAAPTTRTTQRGTPVAACSSDAASSGLRANCRLARQAQALVMVYALDHVQSLIFCINSPGPHQDSQGEDDAPTHGMFTAWAPNFVRFRRKSRSGPSSSRHG